MENDRPGALVSVPTGWDPSGTFFVFGPGEDEYPGRAYARSREGLSDGILVYGMVGPDLEVICPPVFRNVYNHPGDGSCARVASDSGDGHWRVDLSGLVLVIREGSR